MKEIDVGITEFINKHEGFHGIIKQRYSDFHVSEIDLDGNCAQLKHMLPPEEIEPPVKSESFPLNELLDQDTIDKLNILYEKGKPNVEIDVTLMLKENRRKIHKAIQNAFNNILYSNTKAIDNKRLMVICKTSTLSKREIRTNWPEERAGKYVRFIMLKENLDTNEAISELASVLRLNPSCIAYAGTKDKRGITSQWLSIFKMEPSRLHEASLMLRNIKLGNYSYKQRNLRLGDLRGNRFRLALRNVTGTDEQIEAGMKSLKEHGFINYYGMQRFGNSNIVPTYEIGRALLLSDWRLAVELILKPREGESPDISVARRIWWTTRNPNWAFKSLRDYERSIEGKLLAGLSLRGANNFLDALERIPRNTRLMYLHAYQSYVWNKIASRRIQEFGLKPIVGDLILVQDGTEENIERELMEPDTYPDNLEEAVSKRTLVRPITKDDIQKGITIENIVLPLPGYDIQYPHNDVKDWYEEILAKDGLSTQGLRLNVKKYSVGGDYRKLVIKPKDLTWSTMKYSHPKKNLLLSDFQILQRHEEPEEDSDGQYKALLLNFELPCSTYATMMLREILKMDTSSSFQATLNNYHKEKSPNPSDIPSLFALNLPSPSSSQKNESGVNNKSSSTTESDDISQPSSFQRQEKENTEPDSSSEYDLIISKEEEEREEEEDEEEENDSKIIKSEPKEISLKMEPLDMEYQNSEEKEEETNKRKGIQSQCDLKRVKLEFNN